MQMGQRSTVDACSVCCSLPHKSPLLIPPALHRPPQHGPHVSRKGPLNAAVGLKADCRVFRPPSGDYLVALPDGQEPGGFDRAGFDRPGLRHGRQVGGSEAVELVVLASATPRGVTVADPAQGLLKPAKAEDDKK